MIKLISRNWISFGLFGLVCFIGLAVFLFIAIQETDAYIDTLIIRHFNYLEKPAQNAQLVFNPNKNDFEVVPSQVGQKINRDKLEKEISWQNLFGDTLRIPLIKIEPEITSQKAKRAQEKVWDILAVAPYLVKYQEQNWPIEQETILEWLKIETGERSLKISLDQEKITTYLASLAPVINQPAINARLGPYSQGQSPGRSPGDCPWECVPQILEPAQDKIELDIEGSAAFLAENISQQKKETFLILLLNPAQVRTENIENLGLTSFLGQGQSNFAGSPASRIHNIKLGAAKFDRFLIKPAEEFSFNQILGEIGPQQGYLEELVIKKDKTIPEYGGGLCQVSTTLFRAVVKAGLKITERVPHAFPVVYYSPQGFDATIYPPHPDLRFINDTPNYIYIQSQVKDNELFFEIYGTDDGRHIELEGPFILEKNEDGSMKTILTRKISQDDKLISQDKFYSHYKSPDLYPVERNPLE